MTQAFAAQYLGHRAGRWDLFLRPSLGHFDEQFARAPAPVLPRFDDVRDQIGLRPLPRNPSATVLADGIFSSGQASAILTSSLRGPQPQCCRVSMMCAIISALTFSGLLWGARLRSASPAVPSLSWRPSHL